MLLGATTARGAPFVLQSREVYGNAIPERWVDGEHVERGMGYGEATT